MTAGKVLRCAIYTRVSSDAGLEQDFNSLDAQREAAEAYVRSQAHEGWRLRRERYDDGGYSGGTMERPALQRLLADVAQRRLDVVVVYKVDRLTRALADFAKLVELFDAHGVSFVSVTQSFNTTTSMGHLTLNVLLSFAQFEREVTGERIRDKIAASKKKGLWMGGVVPLGYRVEARKLLVDEAEATMVRLIFQRYLDLGSLPALQRALREQGVTSRPRVLASGRAIGGVAFTNGPLAHVLKNRTYLGDINHRGQSHRGEHAAIVDATLFDAVQARLAQNLNRRDLRKGKSEALLTGCIVDDRGNAMSPSHANKCGVRYRYYVSSALVQGRKGEAGSLARVPAQPVEALVLDALRQRLGGDLPADGHGWRALLQRIGLRVEVGGRALDLSWTDAEREETGTGAASPLPDDGHCDADHEGERRHLSVALDLTAQRRRRAIILPDDAPAGLRPIRQGEQQHLLRAIAQGRGWLKEVLAGTPVRAIALRENRSERMVRMLLSLAFLDPELVRAALHGSLPRGVNARRLTDAPMGWHAQWRAVDLSRPD